MLASLLTEKADNATESVVVAETMTLGIPGGAGDDLAGECGSGERPRSSR